MAKLYQKLQLLTGYDDWPKAIITEQMFNEPVYEIRRKEKRIRVWYYMLVPVNKLADLKANRQKSMIDIKNFGRMIEYFNNRDEIKQMSGSAIESPKIFQKWIAEHYNSFATIDETISLTYINDDIRICAIQRAIPQQEIGVKFRYFVHQQFYYIKLTDDLPSNLAHRAGLKSYDRIMSFNGINIENDTLDQFLNRIDTERHLPIQILVCSPVTYEHYKSNKKFFHYDLPIIQCLTSIYATLSNKHASNFHTSTSEVYVVNTIFWAVLWENISIISTVS
ncbi:unnamed protein product [Rotaria sordida]|uniref:PDZ domain-containing protein n=1 Tax=Rotaria sordida TaxID=392033 RepID=A0A815HY76_9BILA|nr:unnamed protein product [Rotaria sordida]CAF1294689.1 unnamed protein product [Rotaria sordida]CAF1358723.1 unnamed protein product [Rotaria sordida]CAF1569663.1 unnamed protein product [Rotaria sordida]CAF3768742.1 unnamed protein product [Rotaria sordida]